MLCPMGKAIGNSCEKLTGKYIKYIKNIGAAVSVCEINTIEILAQLRKDICCFLELYL